MYIHSLLWIDFGYIYICIYIYIYIYIVEGKRQINYQFIPTDLFRGCPLFRGSLMSGQPLRMGWTGSLFVFFLPQYIHRSTTMYWALSYVVKITLYIYMYLYIQSQFTKAKMRIHLIGTFYMTTFANYSIHFSCNETFLRKKKCFGTLCSW